MALTLLKSVFKFPKKNIFECILPFLYLTRTLDYFNFTIEGKLTSAVIKIKAFNIVTFLAYRLVYIPAIILSIKNGPETYNSFLMDTGNYVFLVACQTLGLISVIIQFLTCNHFWDVLKNCYEVDRTLEHFRIVQNHQKHFIYFLKFVSFEIIFFTITITMSIQIYQSSLLQNLIPFGNICVLFTIFSILLSFVIVRFESINL